MLNFLIFPPPHPRVPLWGLVGLFSSQGCLKGMTMVLDMSQHHCKALSAPALGQPVWHGTSCRTSLPWRCEGQRKSLSPKKWSGRWRTDLLSTWSVWNLGTTLCSFCGAACCHPCLRCMFSPLFLEEANVGYLTVNWAGLCLFPASPDHISKSLVQTVASSGMGFSTTRELWSST